MGFVVHDIDHGYRQLLVNVRKMGRSHVRVGVNEEQHAGRGGLTNAQLGAIHEFGLGVPQRSFLRAWVDENQRGWLAAMKQLALRALYGREAWENRFGQYAVDGIKARMRAGIAPELQAATIARKASGNPTPLLDTEQLINAIEYEVGGA